MRCAAVREFAANDSERGEGQNRKLGPVFKAKTKSDSMKDTNRTVSAAGLDLNCRVQ